MQLMQTPAGLRLEPENTTVANIRVSVRRRHALLPPLEKGINLELIETRTFGSRVVYMRYRRVSDGL